MVKLDIISGFLGAGKTTLIKQILQACIAGKERVVLVENEFGEVSIDSEILRIEGFDVYELSRGCVCCTLKEDFVFTLIQILDQNPDRIIFEPSGIFVLNEIFDLFKNPRISAKCRINSITTVVDGLNFYRQKNNFACFLENQIANASALIISKTQFLNVEEISTLRKDLHQMNAAAEIVSNCWDDLTLPEITLLLDGNTRYALNNSPYSFPAGNHGQIHHHSHGFESLGLRTSRNIEMAELENILKQFAHAEYGQILRGKGIVTSRNSCLEFNYVDGQYSITESKSVRPGIASFIGRGLQRDKLIAAFV